MPALDNFTWIGLIAASCTTISFLPQVIKVIKEKKTRDISLSMYAIFSLGILLWLIYGIMIRDIPIILANSITFSLSFIILILKIRYK
ncbi:MAG: SemiSWEET transporter [Gammaproteobacteria bacterium]|nr:SemiSWEET transporter [Gammaproteobacteria bacterium]